MLELLLVDDDQVDRLAVARALERSGLRVRLHEAVDGATALARVRERAFDALLLDYRLPDIDGLSFLQQLMANENLGAAVIVLTGQDNGALALEMMEAGAHDYLIKSEVSPSLLERSLRYALARRQYLKQEQAVRRRQVRELSEVAERKDQFLSNVSHELRSPLNTVHNFVEAILRGPAERLDAEHRGYLELTRDNLLRLRGMIDDLVEATRAGSGGLVANPQRVVVAEEVGGTIESLARKAEEKGISLEAELPERLPAVLADGKRLCQILANLLENAIKFTPEGGRVVVRALEPGDGAGQVRFEVADTGCGIDARDQPRIFQRLYRVREDDRGATPGLGIGLYLCRELVARQGGRIWVRSAPGQGSTFCFTLPVWSVAAHVRDVVERANYPMGSVPAALTIVLSSRQPGRPISVEVLERLERCIGLRSSDLLLPPIARDAGHRWVVRAILWLTNGEPGQAPLRRIRSICKSLPGLEPAAANVEVSVRRLPEADADAEEMVWRLLDLMDSELGDQAERLVKGSVIG